MNRYRPYLGQKHTDTGIRGMMEVSGLTFRDLRDCYIRAWCLSSGVSEFYTEADKGELANLDGNVLYKLPEDIDPIAIFQNFSCEIEKMIGVFPNVPKFDMDGELSPLRVASV